MPLAPKFSSFLLLPEFGFSEVEKSLIDSEVSSGSLDLDLSPISSIFDDVSEIGNND